MTEQRKISNMELRKLIQESTKGMIPDIAKDLESSYMKINDNLQICLNGLTVNEFQELDTLIETFMNEHKKEQ